MTEAHLRAFEARYRRDERVTLNWDELQSLTAEIRRLQAEVGKLKQENAKLADDVCKAWETAGR